MRAVRSLTRTVAGLALLCVLGGMLLAPSAVAAEGSPAVQLTRDGVLVDPGSEVPVGATVRVSVSGFPADARVRFTVGTVQLVPSVLTNASGSGAVDLALPPTLPSSVYVLAANGSLASAAFVFYVYNPPKATPTPTPPPARTATPTPVATTVVVVSTGGDGDTSASGGSLPTTGASLAPLLGGAALSLLVGLALVAAGRSRRAGRHRIT